MIANLEDLWGELEPQNIPGTGAGTAHPEQPNWRRKARHALERILADRQMCQLLEKAFLHRNGRKRKRV